MRRDLAVLLVCLLLVPQTGFSGIITREKAGHADRAGWRDQEGTGAFMIKEGWLGDRVICVDGLKLFQTVAPAWGDGASPTVSTIQLYEERDSKVVPAKCP